MGDVFDVLTMGRVGVDLYPEQSGVPLADVRTFAKFLGGSATNVAVGAARYGHRSAVITKVGDDGFGAYVRQALRGFGVDPRFVGTDRDLRTPVVFIELLPPESPPILFYRQPKAPDMNLTVDGLDLDAVRSARVFWTTGTGLSDEPSRSATLAALRERGRKSFTVHDLDHRPTFWRSPEEAGPLARQALGFATVAVGNVDEVTVAVGSGTPEAQASRLLDLGLELAIVKLGGDGVLAAWDGGAERVTPVEVEVVNGLGAGDAFGAALCHGLLERWEVVDTVRFANAAGAYVAGQLACADAMPNEAQVRAVLVDA
ncbi:MAG TPA: 5-dehydro-2-deoxygluconokinase [Actinomycetota bacterium]|nr:5-dehydro-2-deoxygluconokinase [Actinomycetota bacterium]